MSYSDIEVLYSSVESSTIHQKVNLSPRDYIGFVIVKPLEDVAITSLVYLIMGRITQGTDDEDKPWLDSELPGNLAQLGQNKVPTNKALTTLTCILVSFLLSGPLPAQVQHTPRRRDITSLCQ